MKPLWNIIAVVLVVSTMTMAISCSKKLRSTGFLSDYSNLKPEDGSLRYVDTGLLGDYSQFIIEPVRVRIYHKLQSSKPDSATLTALANYMHNAIINAVGDRYEIVSQAGPGVARIRIAITDIESSLPVFNVLPQTRLTGEALGGASLEAELLDSESGVQIGAVIESRKSSKLSLASLSDWGDAQSVMDHWAKRFRERLDEAHGRK